MTQFIVDAYPPLTRFQACLHRV